jgi:HEAT repeat protein
MDMIAEFENPEILPAVRKAMKDDNADVRTSAVNALYDVSSAEADALLAETLDDLSEDVREAAVDAVENRDDNAKLALCRYGILSSHKDVQEDSISMISEVSSKRSVEILIDALKMNDKEIKDEVNDALDYFVGHTFKNRAEAERWWRKNSSRFSDELEELD